jgi:hypothetical protein
MAAQSLLAGQEALLGQRAMVLGETCKMAATSADRRKLAVLGTGRADWLCIGTSFDALGVPGARHRPRPRPQNLPPAPCADLNGVMAPSACERSQMTMLDRTE